MHALGLEFGSATQLSKRPGSVWNCLWGNALKRSHGIIRRVGWTVPTLYDFVIDRYVHRKKFWWTKYTRYNVSFKSCKFCQWASISD